MFKPVGRDKISLEIVRQIREAVLTGQLAPGDRLPPEKELLEELGVSKHTLREALRALEVLGFLEIKKGAGGGAFVSEVDLATTRESIANFLHFRDVSVTDLSETRKVIEPYLARRAAGRLSPVEIEQLEAMNRACRADLDRGESIVGARHEINFHRLLARASGNPVLVLILDFVNGLLEESKLKLKPDIAFGERVLAAHQRVLEAIKAGDADRAEAEMFNHVVEVDEALERLRARQEKETGASQ